MLRLWVVRVKLDELLTGQTPPFCYAHAVSLHTQGGLSSQLTQET